MEWEDMKTMKYGSLQTKQDIFINNRMVAMKTIQGVGWDAIVWQETDENMEFSNQVRYIYKKMDYMNGMG